MLTRRVIVVAALLVCAVSAGFYVAARPYLPKHADEGIKLPTHEPAKNASGWRAWMWPDGLPGWKPGEQYKGIDISGVQAVEVQAAQLPAARAGLDSSDVRVLTAMHPDRNGVIAILAAPTRDETPVRTCLAAAIRDLPVVWECPRIHHLSQRHIYGVAVMESWPAKPGSTKRRSALYVVGVARGDVNRVVLGDQTLYTRGTTWGEFAGAWVDNPSLKRLRIYGHGRLLESIPLDLEPGQHLPLR